MDWKTVRPDLRSSIRPARLALRYMNIMIPIAGRLQAMNTKTKAPYAHRQLPKMNMLPMAGPAKVAAMRGV